MSNIYLNVTIEKNRRSQNFDFPSLKNMSLIQLKKQRSESKTVCGCSVILILKGIMMF